MRADAVRRGLIHGRSIRRFERFVVLDALVYPYAEPELLEVVGGFNQCLFFLDDQYDHHPDVGRDPAQVREIVERAFDTVATGRLGRDPSPFHLFCADIGARIRSHASARLWTSFVEHFHDYLFEGVVAATASWGTVLPPAEYRRIRLSDSGTWCVPDLVEIASGVELDDAHRSDPLIQEMRLKVCEHATFVNDLASYHREVVRTGGTFNLVLSLMHHETDGDLTAAIDAVVAELNAIEDRFEELAHQTTGSWRIHADTLRYWISGNHRFSFNSGRYHHPDAHLPELRVPPADTPEPLDERIVSALVGTGR